MLEFNENDFIQANTNAAPFKVTIELSVNVNLKGSSFGYHLLSLRKSDMSHFFEAINVLEGRLTCVGEEWDYMKLSNDAWRWMYQNHVRGGIIEEMELANFTKIYSQFIIDIKTSKELHLRKPISKQVLGRRDYNLDNTKDQFNTKYELSDEEIDEYNPLDIGNIIKAYRHKFENYYFDDTKKYYGLFLYFS